MSHLPSRRGRAAMLLVSALALVLVPQMSGVPAAHAASAIVTDCTTFGTPLTGLGAALTAANTGGGTITFNCPTHPVGKNVITVPTTVSPAFDFTSPAVVTIDGSDGGLNDVVIDGGSTSNITGVQIFRVDGGASLTLKNLTLQNGNSQDPATGTPHGNSDGGAVQSFGNFSAINDSFLNNRAENNGGALELDTNTAATVALPALDTITGSTFTGNTANYGPVAGPTAGFGGGAIDISNGPILRLLSTDAASGPQTVMISKSTFTNNSTVPPAITAPAPTGIGGAILSSNNTSGPPDTGALVSIDNSLFTMNTADAEGGAIENDGDSVSVFDSLFTGNKATGLTTGAGITIGGLGGAIGTDTHHGLTIMRSTFNGNSVGLPTAFVAGTGVGGAVFINGGTTATSNAITNSTFAGNTAGDGGAIFVAPTFGLSLDSDTIAGDTTATGNMIPTVAAGGNPAATAGAGLTVGTPALVTAIGTIFSNNLDNAIAPAVVKNCGGPASPFITDDGFNLEWSGGPLAANNTCIVAPGLPSDVTTKDPLLGPLGSYGGPSALNGGLIGAGVGTGQLTLPLSPSTTTPSPAIDAGGACNPPITTDERGATRPFPAGGNCDIGAFEAQACGISGVFDNTLSYGSSYVTSDPTSKLTQFISFRSKTSRLQVNNPKVLNCSDFAATAETIQGTALVGTGIYRPGDTVTITVTQATGPTPPLGTIVSLTVVVTRGAVTIGTYTMVPPNIMVTFAKP